MKKIQYSILLILISCICSFSQKKLKFDIKQVNLYPQSAVIQIESRTEVENGNNEFILSHLPYELNENNVQIRIKGEASLNGYLVKSKDLASIPKTKEYQALEDSLEHIKYSLDSITNFIYALEKEEALILENIKIGGENVGVKSTELEDIAEIYREKIPQIKNLSQKAQTQFQKIKPRYDRLKLKLDHLESQRTLLSNELILKINSTIKTNIVLEISYAITTAYWTPFYELKVKSTTENPSLIAKANITQNSGQNWENVKLILTNNNISDIASIPTLQPQQLRINNPMMRTSKKNTSSKAEEIMEMDMSTSSYAAPMAEKSNVQEVNTDVNTKFEVNTSLSLHTGNTQSVELFTKTVNANFVRYVVPKLNNQTMILAQISNWEELNLVSSNMAVYYQGALMGNTFIDINSTLDSLQIPLAYDNSVVVERKSIKEFTSKKIVGTNKIDEKGFEIKIKNNNRNALKLQVIDQIPISTNSQIEVQFLDESGANYNPETGILTWNLNLSPTEIKNLVFKYSIKYPKDKSIY